MKVLQAYLEVSIAGVALITTGFLLFAVSGGKIPARYRKRIWLLLALQLLIPFRTALPNAPVTLPSPDLTAPLPFFSTLGSQPLPRVPSNSGMVPLSGGISFLQVCFFLWMAGLVGYGLFQIGGYLYARRKMMRWSTPVTDMEVTGLLEQLRQTLRIRSRVELRWSKEIHSPFLMGVFRPVIVLPAASPPDETLRLILCHELIHHKHRDILYKFVLLAARTLHWFNPVVHLMTRQAEVDMEFACDDAVIRVVGSGWRVAYGEAILSAAGGVLRFGSALTTHFDPGKKNLIERMKNLMNQNKRSAGMLIAALFLVLFLACGLLVGFAGATDGGAVPTIHPGYVQEHYPMLLGLRVDGYEAMTVSAFREAALRAMDEPETFAAYAREIDSDDAYLWDYRYVDADASFIRNTLVPLVAEKWLKFEYPNWVQHPATQGPVLEYRLTRELLAPNHLTVGEYQRTVFGLMDEITTLTLRCCEGENVDEDAILSGLSDLEVKYSSERIRFSVSEAFIDTLVDGQGTVHRGVEEAEGAWEEERAEQPSEADLSLLLALRYDGYQDSTVADFTTYVQNAFSEDDAPIHGAFERVMRSLHDDSISPSLTVEDLAFLQSVEISVREYVSVHQSQYAEETLYPTFTGYYFGGEEEPYSIAIEYAFQVKMERGGFVTVAQRDARIDAILTGMQTYLSQRSDADWSDGEAAFLSRFDALCDEHSDANMKCTRNKAYYAVQSYPNAKPEEGR